MKIANALLGVLLVVFSVLLFGIIGPGRAEQEAEEMFVPQRPARHDVVYYCKCVQPCDCPSVSIRPGKSACGKRYEKGHILKIEGSEAVICQNSGGCRCYPVDPLNPTVCTCGLPTSRVSLAGSGLYYCNCGSSCFCNYLSDSPGSCKCGMGLVRAK
ncbi:hypothetical protein ACFLYW_00875 [Thermodesulfobacteriota bacterium]